MAADLPQGFSLDETSGPPAGFTLDPPSKPTPKTYTDWKGNVQVMTPEFEKAMESIHGWGTGIPKIAYNAGGAVTDFASKAPFMRGVPAAALGYAANLVTEAVPALFGGKLMQETVKPAMEGAGRLIMQSAIKPSPTLGKEKIARGVNTLLQEGYSPTNAGVEAMQGKVGDLSTKVEQTLAPLKKVVSVAPAAQNAATIADKARQATLGVQDANTASNVASSLYSHPNVDQLGLMSIQDAQAMKQANYKTMGDAAYGLGLKPAAERDALKAVTAGLRNAIEKVAPDVVEPNAKMQELMNAVNMVKRRALVEGNKDIIPLGSTIATAVHNPAAALGMYANSSAAVKGMIARMLYSGAKAAPAVGAIGGAYLGAQSGQSDEAKRKTLVEQLRNYLGEE